MDHLPECAAPGRRGASSGPQPLRLRVNGRDVDLSARLSTKPLSDVLRSDLGLHGVKRGCAHGRCGACAVLLDGEVTASCRVGTAEAADRDVLTIEGLLAEPDNRVIAGFAAERALDCGACWPGVILAAAALLADHWRPTDAEIDRAMGEAPCQCGGDPRVRRAIRRAAGFPPG